MCNRSFCNSIDRTCLLIYYSVSAEKTADLKQEVNNVSERVPLGRVLSSNARRYHRSRSSDRLFHHYTHRLSYVPQRLAPSGRFRKS